MKYLTVLEVTCVGGKVCETRVEPLMDALLDLEESDHMIEDPDLAANLVTGCVDVQMVVDAADPGAAMVKAFTTLRAAIHAIGDATPGWETASAVGHVAPVASADRLLTPA